MSPSLANPLLGLGTLAAFVALFLLQRSRPKPSLVFPGLEDFRSAPASLRVALFRLRPWGRALVAVLLCLALARPRAGRTVEVIQAQGVDIMVALDVSGSMSRGRDLPPNRLAVAKRVLAEFIAGRRHDRIGMVVFAGSAFTRCPLTLDYSILRTILDSVQEGMVAEDGTAIGMALASCVNRLRGSEAKTKVAILLTDGDNNAGSISPDAAADLAAEKGVKVYTVGVGGDPGQIAAADLGFFGLARPPALDEALLRRIADGTGGRYFRATDTRALQRIFETIDRLERSEIESQSFTRYRELFHELLAIACVLLVLDLVLGMTYLRALP